MRIRDLSKASFRRTDAVHCLIRSFGIVLIIGFAGSLTACSTMSDHRLISNTFGVLGIPPEDLTISDKRSNANATYYIATTRTGRKYSCVVTGGGALTLGLANPPSCNPVAKR